MNEQNEILAELMRDYAKLDSSDSTILDRQNQSFKDHIAGVIRPPKLSEVVLPRLPKKDNFDAFSKKIKTEKKKK